MNERMLTDEGSDVRVQAIFGDVWKIVDGACEAFAGYPRLALSPWFRSN